MIKNCRTIERIGDVKKNEKGVGNKKSGHKRDRRLVKKKTVESEKDLKGDLKCETDLER